MATTKRDFEAVAAIIAKAFEHCQTEDAEASLLEVSDQLAHYFDSQNARFKREQFLEACGIEYEYELVVDQ